jgi:phage shock protein PspC (stress-responsive transcriptional regulator)
MNENPVPSSGTSGTHGFYAWIDSLRTVRSSDRWLGGVVAGIADRLGMDRTLGRALFVVLTLLTSGLTVLFYGLAWMVLPEPDGRIHAREAGLGRWTSGTTGALVLTVLGLGNLFSVPARIGRDGGFWGFGSLVGLAVIGVFVWLVVSQGGRRRALPPGQPAESPQSTPSPQSGTSTAPTQPVYLAPSDTGWYSSGTDGAPGGAAAGGQPAGQTAEHPPTQPLDRFPQQGPDPMSATSAYPTHPTPSTPQRSGPAVVDRTPPSLSGATQLVVVGLAVLAGAAIALLRYLGVFTASWPVIWAAALATALGVMAIGIIIGAIGGRGGGGLTVTTAILAIPVVGATGGAFIHVGPWGGTWDGNRTWDGGVLHGNPAEGYSMSFGDATIDLTGLRGSSPAQAQASPVEVDLSFSTAELVVPDNVDVFLAADNAFSSVNAPSVGTDSAGRLQVVDAPGTEQLIVEADLSFSTLTVRTDTPTAGTTEQD